MKEYNEIWNDNSSMKLDIVTQKYLKDLLKIFDIEGWASLNVNTTIQEALSKVTITQASIEVIKTRLSQQLAKLGEEYNEINALDSSFADSLFGDTSVANDSLLGDDANNNLNINNDSTGDSEGHFSVESEISAGERSGTETDDTKEIFENLKKYVQFDKTPPIQTISPWVGRN